MIILLNGTSSAGKTSIARVLQQGFNGILLYYGVDIMVQGAFPEKCDEPPWDEHAIRLRTSEIDGVSHATLQVSPYMYPVYRSAVAFYRDLSRQGYDLIVDEVLFDARRVDAYFELLRDERVHFIGVKPEKAVAIERERARGDRIPGLAAGLYDEVYHPAFEYDLLLDTGRATPHEAAAAILHHLDAVPQPTGFRDSAARWPGDGVLRRQDVT